MLTGRTDTTYWVELWEQPLRDWIIAHLYHRYETFMWKSGIVKLIEKLYPGKKIKATAVDTDDEFEMNIPFGCGQDLRCFDLVHKHRDRLLKFQITEEQYHLKSLDDEIEL